MSVLDNIAFGLKTPQYLESLGRLDRPLTPDELLKIVREKLKLVQLAESVLPKMPSEISYGMQKRVSLARTLAPGPDYLLFDEPTTGLDPIVTTAINDLIQELSRALQVTSIVVSHDMRCALSIADRILMLDQGRILETGTVEQIRKSKQPLIRDFLSEALETEASL
jgi:phospholipid/cholesterol/gamma-HCH transport system ATP-binding protein